MNDATTKPKPDDEARIRFRAGCRMLRNAGHLDLELPEQKSGESLIDWLVRAGLATDAYTAVDMLLVGKDLYRVRDDVLSDADLREAFLK